MQAVLSSERARGRLRRATPDEALRTWTALVRGHWTILEGVERDGKRLLFARRNPLGAPGLLDLSCDPRGGRSTLTSLARWFGRSAHVLSVGAGDEAGAAPVTPRPRRATSRGAGLRGS